MPEPRPAGVLPDVLPVFPLPNTVFFPDTVIGLHIFEPRYRQMIHDVAADHGLLVVSLLRGEDFHSVATVGRIRQLQSLDDGRFNLRLVGLHRVDVTEVPSSKPYRLVRASPRTELGAPRGVDLEPAKLDLLASLGLLLRESTEDSDEQIVLDDRMPFDAAVNTACSGLPIDADSRQMLLEEDDIVARQRQATETLQDVLETLLSLRVSSGQQRDDGAGLN